eukprot:symbB.v1.2.016801.t1/scaffold1270.1/size227213/13
MKKEPLPTSYSAVPAHHMSLMTLAKEAKNFESPLKVIRNDSAALLPSLAEQMEDFFQATVLPAYSMTEANPLCSNPRYGVRKLKSVGPAVGPELAVMEAWPSNKRVDALNSLRSRRDGAKNSNSVGSVAYNVVIHAVRGRSVNGWSLALSLLKNMDLTQVLLSLVTFNTVIRSCQDKSPWALSFLSQLREISSPDVISYSSTMDALDWIKAFHLLKTMKVTPNVFCFSSVVNAVGKDWHRAVQLLLQQSNMALVPNVVSYSGVINACSTDSWRTSTELLQRMSQEAVRANIMTYGSVISACENGWLCAMDLLEVMMQQQMKSNVICFNSAINACETSRDAWREAVEVLMRSISSPTVVSFSSTISACVTFVAWQMASTLSRLMNVDALQPNVISMSSMISAFQKAHQWRTTLRQLQDLQSAQLFPNLTCFNALLAAGSDSSWCMVMKIWKKMLVMQAGVGDDLTWRY